MARQRIAEPNRPHRVRVKHFRKRHRHIAFVTDTWTGERASRPRPSTPLIRATAAERHPETERLYVLALDRFEAYLAEKHHKW